MMTRKRILMIAPDLGYGGAEKSFSRWAEAFATIHDVTSPILFRWTFRPGKTYSRSFGIPGFALNDFGHLRKSYGLMSLSVS
jgi:hypothetical protein